MTSPAYREGFFGPSYLTKSPNRGVKRKSSNQSCMVPGRGSSQPPNPNPFSLGHREEHTDMDRAAHLQHKQDVKKWHGRKASMTQKKQRGKQHAIENKPKKQTALYSSRRNLSNVMNLRKPDFSAEMIKQQREGNKKIKARKTN